MAASAEYLKERVYFRAVLSSARVIKTPKLSNRFAQNSVKQTNTKICQLILGFRLVVFIQLSTRRTTVTYTVRQQQNGHK